MSQRPHLGSISSSPGETTDLTKLAMWQLERRKQKLKTELKPFPTSFNTLLFIPSMYPHPTSCYPEHGVITSQLLEASLSRSHSLLRLDLSRNIQVMSMLPEEVFLILIRLNTSNSMKEACEL